MFQKIINNPIRLLLLFWIVIIICYYPTWQYGIYTDFADTMYLYRNNTFWEFINRKGIVNISLYQGTLIILYVLISIFGTNPLLWFLLFTFLHAFCGILIFTFFSRYFNILGIGNAVFVALLGVILFLLAPIVTEVVIWKACFHYFTAVGIIFIILNLTLSYLKSPNVAQVICIAALYYVSTFMLELFYLTPVFVFILIFSLRINGKISATKTIKGLVYILIPLVVLWCVYLFTYYALYGRWIAHYEIDIKQSFEIPQIMSSLSKSILRIYFFEYLLPHNIRNKLLSAVSTQTFGWISFIVLVSIALLYFRYFKKLSVKWRWIGIMFVFCFSACILIMPLWYNDVNIFLNNRYYYLPSVFFFMLFAVVFIPQYGKLKWHQIALIGGYCLFSISVTFFIIHKVKLANKVYQSLFNTYDFTVAKETDTFILLNIPNNLDGINIMPSENGNDFKNHFYIVKNTALKQKIMYTYSHNIVNINDGARVTVIDNKNIKVTLNQNGTWWWYNSLGASNFENDIFTLTIIDNGMSYLLTFEHPADNIKLLYYADLRWHVIDSNKLVVKE